MKVENLRLDPVNFYATVKGVAPGEGYSPLPSGHASPRRKVKSDFFGDFGIYSTLNTIF